MAPSYFEFRKQSARGTDSLAADLMRHLHTRQYLGKTVVTTEHPYVLFCAARKQWLKLARNIQKQRASTLNADKILKYTHTITHMQHLRFTIKSPTEEPEADVYFLTAEQTAMLPALCYTMYITAPVTEVDLRGYAQQLPTNALIVDYTAAADYEAVGLQPKAELEQHVRTEWDALHAFLSQRHIDASQLMAGGHQNIDAMDDALDTLLGTSRSFLQLANQFQQALELARPLRLSKETRLQYDALALLAHRVQSLQPGAFSKRFLETYNEDDTFFLYEALRSYLLTSGENVAQAAERQLRAGRQHLSRALTELVHGHTLALRGVYAFGVQTS